MTCPGDISQRADKLPFRVNLPGARLFVDGKLVARAGKRGTVWLPFGEHEIAFESPDCKRTKKHVVLDGRELLSIDVSSWPDLPQGFAAQRGSCDDRLGLGDRGEEEQKSTLDVVDPHCRILDGGVWCAQVVEDLASGFDVSLDTPDARLLVDDEVVATGVSRGMVWIAPGEHTFFAAPDCVGTSMQLVARSGEVRSLEVPKRSATDSGVMTGDGRCARRPH